MSAAASHMSVTEFAEDGAVIRVTSHKLHEHESKLLLDEAVAYIESRTPRRVAMDFSSVEFISSAALGAMVTISKSVAAIEGGRFVITGLSDDARQVIKLTRLDRIITIEKTLEKAQKHLLKK